MQLPDSPTATQTRRVSCFVVCHCSGSGMLAASLGADATAPIHRSGLCSYLADTRKMRAVLELWGKGRLMAELPDYCVPTRVSSSSNSASMPRTVLLAEPSTPFRATWSSWPQDARRRQGGAPQLPGYGDWGLEGRWGSPGNAGGIHGHELSDWQEHAHTDETGFIPKAAARHPAPV